MSQRNSQRDKLEALLFENFGKEVGLPEIQRLGIAQHGARLNELRKKLAPRGLEIANRMETAADGTKHSFYKLDYRVAIDVTPIRKLEQKPALIPESKDWYEREHGPRPSQHPWKTAFSEKRLAEEDCFVLTPPEPRQ